MAGLEFGYTEWPRMHEMRFGIRIDHVLCTSDWRLRQCWLGPDIGCDHLPLIALPGVGAIRTNAVIA